MCTWLLACISLLNRYWCSGINFIGPFHNLLCTLLLWKRKCPLDDWVGGPDNLLSYSTYSDSFSCSREHPIPNQDDRKQTICPKWSRVGIHYDSPNSPGEQLERCPTGYYTGDPHRGASLVDSALFCTIFTILIVCTIWREKIQINKQTSNTGYYTGDPHRGGKPSTVLYIVDSLHYLH